jgi:peptidoglycan/xylan/chitin deacetylase (PgdA/CDA1 family)
MTRNFTATLSAAVAILMTTITVAPSAECSRADALGTSRVLTVDPATTPRVGLKSFPQTLPLEDHEVVLTFDDGPWPATDRKILAALAQECVRATFFLIGKPASEHPELVRRMAAEGHTVAHHTWTHHNLKYMKPEAAIGEIDKGIILLHDPKAQTAAMLPAFLRWLRDNKYRVVHIVPVGAKTVSGKPQ